MKLDISKPVTYPQPETWVQKQSWTDRVRMLTLAELDALRESDRNWWEVASNPNAAPEARAFAATRLKENQVQRARIEADLLNP